MLPASAYNQISGCVTEKDFQETVTSRAEDLGWWWYHVADSRRSRPGFPDLVLIKPPKVIFLEVKREKGRLTVDQSATHSDIRQLSVGHAAWPERTRHQAADYNHVAGARAATRPGTTPRGLEAPGGDVLQIGGCRPGDGDHPV
jgi:hypothetical protein